MLFRHSKGLAILLFAWLSTLSSWAGAWGPTGHEAVAHLAERNLTPVARARLGELLGRGVSLASIATWADDIRRERPETKPWHFIDIENDARIRRPDIARFCTNHDCVVDQIDIAKQRLADAKLPLAMRGEALRFLVHLIGDLHQPLHCADDGDRGGNDKRLRVDGAEDGDIKLHAFWDNLLRTESREDPRALAERLDRSISKRNRLEWQGGSTADWAWEGYLLARRVIYADFRRGPTRHPVPLPARYRTSEPRKLVEAQLGRAGIRLAALLNAALDR